MQKYRKVKIQKWEKDPKVRGINIPKGIAHWIKIDDGEGFFHGWGVDYDETEFGCGSYTTAIIERENGIIETPPADMIQFIAIEHSSVEMGDPLGR